MPFTLKTSSIKIPQIARWRIAGVTDTKIAELIHMSIPGLARILATDEYKQYEAALLNGHLSDMDRALAGKVSAIHQEMRQAVPAALRALVDTVTQRRDLKAAMVAAKEILNRDPDRSLPDHADSGDTAQGIPTEVLEAAAAEGNKIASNYDAQVPGGGKPN
jgi:hypothetical protein